MNAIRNEALLLPLLSHFRPFQTEVGAESESELLPLGGEVANALALPVLTEWHSNPAPILTIYITRKFFQLF